MQIDRLFESEDLISVDPVKVFYAVPKGFIHNVDGVSANPGSREFHAYRYEKVQAGDFRTARREEYGRIREAEVKEESQKVRDEFRERGEERRRVEEEATRKKREKRQKKRGKSGKKTQDTKEDEEDKEDE